MVFEEIKTKVNNKKRRKRIKPEPPRYDDNFYESLDKLNGTPDEKGD